MIKKLFVGLFLGSCLCGCTFNSDNKIELSFATWGSVSELAVIKQVVKEFEDENSDLKIRIQHIPQNYFKKLHLLFASNSEPDVILINNQYIPTYADYLLTLSNAETVGFYKTAVKSLTYKNELKAIPRDVSTLMIYYNKELVSPRKGWKLEDLLQDGARLKAKGKFAIVYESDLLYLYPFLMSLGESPESVTAENLFEKKGVKFFSALSREYHYAPLLYELGMATPVELFLNEKSAYYLSGRWMYPKLTEIAPFQFGMIEFPAGENGSRVPCDATGWAVSKRSRKQEEALRFVKYLSSASSLKKMGESGLLVPARVSVANEIVDIDVFLRLAESSPSIRYPKNYDRYKDEINTLLKIESR